MTRQRVNSFELVSKELSARLDRLPEDELRRISIRAARKAVEHIGLDHPIIDDAFAALAAGNFGDSPVRDRLMRLVEELDERQWDLQDLVDQNKTPKADQSKAFTAARAANAVLNALDSDPLASAQETLYEANAAIRDPDEIRRLVEGPPAAGGVAPKQAPEARP